MSRMLSRDPFARQELHKETINADGQTCSWCGNVARGQKLFIYYTVRDSVRPFSTRRTQNGAFCSKGCFESYSQ